MAIERHLLVGFDGSECSERALEWAVQEAFRREVALRLLYAVPVTMTGTWGYGGRLYALQVGDIEKRGMALLERGERRARELAPGVEVTSKVALEGPAHALLEWGSTADEIVVGSRGLSPAAHVLLGSVSRHTVTHAHVPVVVVREGAGGPVKAGPVVVGLDGSPASSAALAYAVGAAVRRNRPLVAVHAWQLVFHAAFGDYVVERQTIQSQDDELRRLLAEEVEPWRAKYPELDVIDQIVQNHPVDELLEQSKAAELVVVGSHGRNVLARSVLGSVSAALVTRAECPVAVLRPGSWPAAADPR